MKDRLRSLEAKIRVGLAVALVALAMSGCAQPGSASPAETFAAPTQPVLTETAIPNACAQFPEATMDKVIGRESALNRPHARGFSSADLDKCSPVIVVFDGQTTNNYTTSTITFPGRAPIVPEGGAVCYGKNVTSVLALCGNLP